MIPDRAMLQGEHTFFPFAYLLVAARFSREAAGEKPTGSNCHRVSAVLFSAFAVEAYLNHLGEMKLPYWEIVEPKLNWRAKADLVTQHLQFTIDYGSRPFGTIIQLFQFRDRLVHGKTETWEFESKLNVRSPAKWESMPDPEWLSKYWNDNAVDRVIEDVEAAIEFLHEKAGLDLMDLNCMGSSFTTIGGLGALKPEDVRGISRPLPKELDAHE